MLVRFQISSFIRIVSLLLAGCLFAYALHYVWLAFTNPLELEIREGSVWIQVLAKKAGVDIYDKTRVAFVNMNHGPMDPILKHWIACCLPRLPGYMVTRSFVLLFPLLLAGAAYSISRNVAVALLAAGSLYWFLIHISNMLLVGRPDPTALCGVTVCGAIAHQLLVTRHRSWSNKTYLVMQVLFGVASAITFLASWRFAPMFAAFYCVILAKQVAESTFRDPPGTPTLVRWSTRVVLAAVHVVSSLTLSLIGFALVWLPTFLLEMHGSVSTYYERFFGFFSPKSGWGTFQGREFHLFPLELFEPRRAYIWLFFLLIAAGLYRLRKERAQCAAWLVMLPLLWFIVAYGYFKNEGGGGLHYFFEFFLFAWFFVLHSLSRRRTISPLAQLVFIGVLAVVRPVTGLIEQTGQVDGARQRAVAFRADVARLTGGSAVYGEETHLFKTAYHDEVIDTGDAAAQIARTGFYGEEFVQTFQSYTIELLKHPPKFVRAGLLDETNWIGVMTPGLNDLLRKQYEVVLSASGSSFAYGGSQVLFQRKAEFEDQ